ncbi:ABC transporter substrate-binding protein [Sulfurimonas sp. MAG313]|nr:ABC transporter substrate-binding protein [Sulfurimonas sp. MAG313]MDF1881154.1 ABC transporter substrate-binding protein [Sulfurimonas sp. MAG313]
MKKIKMYKLNIIFILIAGFIFSACEKDSEQALRVGISTWPGYEPLALAAEKGFYGDSYIRVVRFATPTESYRALRDGVIDVAAFTADEVFHYAEVRNQPKIFLILDISNGADAIVAKKEIKTIDDLKGKRLGVEGSTLGNYIISRGLDFAKSDIKMRDITFVSVKTDEQEKIFLADGIDAAVTYEPSKSLLLKAGAHVIFDSSMIPNEIIDVLVTNESTIQTRLADLNSLVKGWFKSLDYIKENYKLSLDLMAHQESITFPAFKKAYEDLIIPSREVNKKMLGKDTLILKPMQRLSRLMYANEILEKEIEIKHLLDDRVINSLEE